MRFLLALLLPLLAFAGPNDPVISPLWMDRDVPIANIVQPDNRGALRIYCVNCSGGGVGDATAANQVIGNASLASIDSKLTAPLSVIGPLTDAQLRASPVPVSGNIGRTWNLSSGSDSVSASVSNFPATQDVNLSQILGSAPSVTNWIPARISNGSSYVDPTQIRALTSSDQITVANPTLAVTQSTSPWVTSRTWSLSSGSDSVTSIQGTSPWVVSGTVTANAGTNLNTSALALDATLINRTQFTNLTDGTRDATIKAASTAASAADTSVVVGLSPNSPLPTGSNVIGALTANQSVNVSQMNGVAVSMGAGTTGTGVQRVVLPTDQFPSQGSTTSGQTGPLIQGAVTTSAPAYTTGTTQPVSINTSGELRVAVKGVSYQVDQNRFYSFGVTVNQASSGADNPIILLRNPAGSGKKVRIWKIRGSTPINNTFSIFKVWSNPTVTANGTAITSVSRNVGGGAAAATALPTSLPTVTSNGAQMASAYNAQNGNSVVLTDDFSLAINAGNSILITGAPSANNRAAELTVIWSEE